RRSRRDSASMRRMADTSARRAAVEGSLPRALDSMALYPDCGKRWSGTRRKEMVMASKKQVEYMRGLMFKSQVTGSDPDLLAITGGSRLSDLTNAEVDGVIGFLQDVPLA